MTALSLAQQRLLEPAGLDERAVEKALDTLLRTKLDSADLYFQASRFESWMLEDGIVKEGSYNIDRGVGVRAVVGEKSGFAYSDDIDANALDSAARAARSIASAGQSGRIKAWQQTKPRDLYVPQDPAAALSETQRIELLLALDAQARRADARVEQVVVSLASEIETILIVDSDGTMAGDTRPLTRLNVSVIVEHEGRREQASFGGGGRLGYEHFVEDDLGLSYAREAVRSALVNLEAQAAPAGNLTVVLGPGWPGVLLHEAIGHGLEGDFNRKQSSAFAGRIGDRVASEQCTIVDDGTLAERRGSLNIDDEGVRTQCTTLIENGLLKGYMQDKINARLMGGVSTGNGRRESYAHQPMPRMTNTYMLPGKFEPGEIIESVESGLYAANFGGGEVDITSGKFVFSANEAYVINNGRLGSPVKGATLIGNGPDVLTRVSMVGNDLALDSGIGVCGKDGQSVPVGVGQPTLRIDGLTVGGTDI